MDSLSEDLSLAQAMYDKKLVSMQKNLQGLGKCPGFRHANDQEGGPTLLGMGPGIPPDHGALEQGSLHQASRHKGRTVMAPCLPVQVENPPNKSCYPGICPRVGLRALYVHRSAQSLQVEKKAEDRPLALMYLKLLGWPKRSLTGTNFLASPIFLRLF